jgi:hypothetical protein
MFIDSIEEDKNQMNLEFQIELDGIGHQKMDAFLIPKSKLWEQVQLCMNELNVKQTTPTLPIIINEDKSKAD